MKQGFKHDKKNAAPRLIYREPQPLRYLPSRPLWSGASTNQPFTEPSSLT